MMVEEAAKFLDKSQNTIINWCKSGKLASVPTGYGNKVSYRIPTRAVIAMQEALRYKQATRIYQKTVKKKVIHNHRDLVAPYLQFCASGLHSKEAKPYSTATLSHHKRALNEFFEKHNEMNFHTLRAMLLEIPVEMFGKREKMLRVGTNFTQWMVNEGLIDESEIESIRKRLAVRRVRPPKQHSLKEEQIQTMIDACKNSYERCIVILLSETGLRNSNVCNLTMKELRLGDREIKTIGKGGKEIWVGLTVKAHKALVEYLNDYPVSTSYEAIFKDKNGRPLVRYGLRNRLVKIAKRVGLEAYPHAMRRSFVTINAAKGRSLVDLQLACAHSQISATRMYCKTEQVDVVNRMKDWK